jgi:GlpG protein
MSPAEQPPSTDQAHQPRPWLTIAACIASLAIWLAIQIHALGPEFGVGDARGVHGSRWWTLFVSPWVHHQLWHVAFNCYWLWFLGSRLEGALGIARYAAFIVVAAAVSGMAEVLWDGSTGIGASGVVYAIVGYLAIQRHDPRFAPVMSRQIIALMLIWLVACMVMTVGGAAIGNAAHLCGLALGAALGLAAGHRWRIAGIAGAALLILVAGVALVWPPPLRAPADPAEQENGG